jgi:hypothetical protein
VFQAQFCPLRQGMQQCVQQQHPQQQRHAASASWDPLPPQRTPQFAAEIPAPGMPLDASRDDQQGGGEQGTAAPPAASARSVHSSGGVSEVSYASEEADEVLIGSPDKAASAGGGATADADEADAAAGGQRGPPPVGPEPDKPRSCQTVAEAAQPASRPGSAAAAPQAPDPLPLLAAALELLAGPAAAVQTTRASSPPAGGDTHSCDADAASGTADKAPAADHSEASPHGLQPLRLKFDHAASLDHRPPLCSGSAAAEHEPAGAAAGTAAGVAAGSPAAAAALLPLLDRPAAEAQGGAEEPAGQHAAAGASQAAAEPASAAPGVAAQSAAAAPAEPSASSRAKALLRLKQLRLQQRPGTAGAAAGAQPPGCPATERQQQSCRASSDAATAAEVAMAAGGAQEAVPALQGPGSPCHSPDQEPSPPSAEGGQPVAGQPVAGQPAPQPRPYLRRRSQLVPMQARPHMPCSSAAAFAAAGCSVPVPLPPHSACCSVLAGCFAR